MKNLKAELKQHFVSAYVNQHLQARAGYPEEWNIENLVLAAEAEFHKYLDEPFGKNWGYDALKKVLTYTRDFKSDMYFVADWGNTEHAKDAIAYHIHANFPNDETNKPDLSPKKLEDNPPSFWEIKEVGKFTHGSFGFNSADSHGDIISDKFFKQLSERKPYDIKTIGKRKPFFISTSNDGVNWVDSYRDATGKTVFVGDIADKLEVVAWFKEQGTPKHLSIANRLREILNETV